MTASEIESIEKSLQKVGEDLKENDAPWGILTKFRNETDKLQADLRILAHSNNPDSELRRKTMDDLASVTLNLTTLQRQWSNERYANHSAVSESLLKLKTFRERLEPTTGLEKVAASAMTQLVAFVTGVGKLVVLLAWSIVALAIVWYLFRSQEAPKRITELVSNFKSLEVAGLVHTYLYD